METEIARPDYGAAVEAVVERYSRDPDFLISMLQDLQRDLGCVSPEALRAVAEVLHVPLSRCYSVATFYTSFSLVPRGKHLITVCLGTVCYLKGGKEIAQHIEQELRVKPGETTQDRLFTYQPVNCLGACALAPVVVVDEKYYEHVNVSEVDDILALYASAGEGGHNGDH